MHRLDDIRAAAERKGFRLVNGRDHHCWFFFDQNGRKTAKYFKASHGDREIDSWTLGRMAKSAGISANDFRCLISCTLSQEAYERLITPRT